MAVVVFDPAKIAKLASAFMVLMFAFACLAVIVMRESRIDSYDPGFRSPLYPGLQIAGVLGAIGLILSMGLLPSLFTGGLIVFGSAWYMFYARDKVIREGAIFHVFARLAAQHGEQLDLDAKAPPEPLE
ncbi:MAG: APA family basic amino acid/polyamine antiporter [Rhodothermales bacterium]